MLQKNRVKWNNSLVDGGGDKAICYNPGKTVVFYAFSSDICHMRQSSGLDGLLGAV